MKTALRAEWTKVRTEPSTGWLLVATVGLTIALSAATASAMHYSVATPQDTTKLSLTGIELGQTVVAIIAVLAIAGEYSTGMIRVTLAAIPHRLTMLGAKTTLVGGLAAAAGVIAVPASLLIGRLILPGHGFTATHGYRLLHLADWSTLRAAGGSVLYLVLIALLSLGVATVVRDAAHGTGPSARFT